jgi:voltage-gated potassium channel
MERMLTTRFRQSWYRRRFIYLLILLLSFISFAPALPTFTKLNFLSDLAFSAILVCTIYAGSRKKYQAAVAYILAFPMLLSVWFPYFVKSPAMIMTGRFCGIAFFSLVVFQILDYIFGEKEISENVIAAAVVVYLLIGISWALSYSLLEMVHPGSFNIPPDQIHNTRLLFIYYSYSTLTTMGSDTVQPAGGLSESFTIVEAIVGQLYLVVLITWLVGMHVVRKSK